MKEKKNEEKKFSIFQVVSIVLVIILSIAVVIQIGFIIHFKNKIENLKDKNEQLPNVETQTNEQSSISIEQLNNFQYKIVI